MDSEDRNLSTFANDDEAYDYAVANSACVSDDNGNCVFCRRWDH